MTSLHRPLGSGDAQVTLTSTGQADNPTRLAPGGLLRLQILGPLRLWRDGVELDAGPRQQANLLALLLTRAGRPITTTDLIDLMWDEEIPASAVNTLQKYVGALRRLLEPSVPARSPGSYLHRRSGGYLFAASPGMLDLASFRELVEAAKEHLAQQRGDAALECYERALDLWHGPAGAGLTPGPTAMSHFAALNEELFDACVAASELAVSRGRPTSVLHPLRLAAAMAPLHENVQGSLVLALAAAGRQAEALSVFTAVRNRLAEELGVDPGPALRAAHLRVLSQPWTPAVPSGANGGRAANSSSHGVVGRAKELAALQQVVDSALLGGTGLVLIEGEPGVGKTRLLAEFSAEADQRGALTIWSNCLEGDGTPSMWPWVQVVGAVLDNLPATSREEWHASALIGLLEPRGEIRSGPILPDSGAQFRLFEEVVALIAAQAAARRPVVIVIDDLQWADVASLQMFTHLSSQLPGGTVIIGALRDRLAIPGTELARLLAAASRLFQHRRIHLGPLELAEVAELIRRETGQVPGISVARSIQTRTAGNPFFIRELSRLLADSGPLTEQAAGSAGVPSTVRDVVRDRMAGLEETSRELLQIAALMGREVDLGLLARAADRDLHLCLERLEPLEARGLIEQSPDNPYLFCFVHDLVREAVVRTIPPTRATRLHLRVADALEASNAGVESMAERLAHHLWAAGPLADPARTGGVLVRAGRCAAAKSAFDAAGRWLVSAAEVARAAGLAELELAALSQLTAVVGMRSGYVGSALDLQERAERLARGLGQEREATDFLFARWAAYSQGIQLDRAGRLARRLLDQGEASSDSVVQAYGRHAWGIHQWDVGNVGEAFRYLSHSNATMLEDLAQREQEPLRHDLKLLSPVMLGLMTALHGDADGSRALLGTVEAAAGEDPYVVTVWAAFAVTAAALAGDPAWALRAAERGIAADSEHSFVFLSSYPRLARCWAQAMNGEDPAGAAEEAQRLVAATLLSPPRSGLATWYGLVAEMWLTAGLLDEAAAALAQADTALNTHGQRYAEGLVLLLHARLRLARGEPIAAVRSAVEYARTLSVEREAHLFARRAEQLLADLGAATPEP